ncbi:MAG TPA: hypothetical protein VJA16_01655 [Thermoanaerobaculia bacterium]
MSCPDWRRLDPAARDASSAPRAAADGARAIDAIDALDALHAVHWQQALSHLDSGCPHCWREALAVDPTLIFRRLPAPELTPAQEAEEVEAARLAVAAMRTASRMEQAARGDAGARSASGRRRRRQDWQAGSGWPALALRRLPAIRSLPSLHVHPARWALAAGLTAMALVYGSGHGWRPLPPMTAAAAPGAAAPAGALASSVIPSTQAGLAGQAGQDMRATSAFAAAAAEPGGQGDPGPRMMPPGWAGASAVQPAASRPSIEGLSRPEARVYQIDSPHMSVVMIVDGKLDV